MRLSRAAPHYPYIVYLCTRRTLALCACFGSGISFLFIGSVLSPSTFSVMSYRSNQPLADCHRSLVSVAGNDRGKGIRSTVPPGRKTIRLLQAGYALLPVFFDLQARSSG